MLVYYINILFLRMTFHQSVLQKNKEKKKKNPQYYYSCHIEWGHLTIFPPYIYSTNSYFLHLHRNYYLSLSVISPKPCNLLFINFYTMQAREITGLNYLLPSDTPPYPSHYTMIQNNIPTFQIHKLSNQFYGFQHQNPPQLLAEFSPQSSCISSNSTSDEADEQQQSLINERKHRRMISNRESARRSRMRKQKHLDELWSQVVWLRNENHQLIDKLNHVSESHDRVAQENVQLREEASELRQMLCDMQLHSPCPPLSPIEDVPTTSPYVKSDSSNQSSFTSSMELLG
ncbi:uncharacterized protein LOC113863596 [Abrus precatorius]|uniref:Uncharacterized protein LOC113863596 n=1 Tax=Abrus precatorius TaxID=3816 RepID=A0A8B8L9Y1_ABRPR|nr:uncharacterized protein LOC113863596 [Abrus precatorius]